MDEQCIEAHKLFAIKKPLCHRNRLPAYRAAGLYVFLDSSAVELTTVNRAVAGSNPARGAISF